MSFTSRIDQLKEDNAKLNQELQEWRDRATTESKGRRIAEKEIHQLYERSQQLQDQVKTYGVEVDYLRSIISTCCQGLDKVLPMLEDLRTGVLFCSTKD